MSRVDWNHTGTILYGEKPPERSDKEIAIVKRISRGKVWYAMFVNGKFVKGFGNAARAMLYCEEVL